MGRGMLVASTQAHSPPPQEEPRPERGELGKWRLGYTGTGRAELGRQKRWVCATTGEIKREGQRKKDQEKGRAKANERNNHFMAHVGTAESSGIVRHTAQAWERDSRAFATTVAELGTVH